MGKRLVKEKKGIVSEYIPWLLIAIAVLVILMLAIYFLSGNSFKLIDKINFLFRK
jgi:hypothetical protein